MMNQQNNKETAVQFLKMVTAGKIDEAYQQYVNMQGKHHNVFFPAGFLNLQKAMKDNESQWPHKHLTIKNALAEGDMVAVHSHLEVKDKGIQMVVVHLFRFKENKIVEMWDCGQAIPADFPNKDGAF